MKRTITGMTLFLALVFTPTAWSQESTPVRAATGDTHDAEHAEDDVRRNDANDDEVGAPVVGSW